jgi:hypothetical protein
MRLLLSAYFTLAAFAPAADGPLEQWQREIEASGVKLAVVRVVTDPARQEMRLQGDPPHRPIIVSYLMNDRFRAELFAAHALTVTHRAAGQTYSFVVLNLAREAEWRPYETGLMAHELGHVWLESQGYQGLPFSGSEDACVAVHANDIVQHILIRAETRRRQIDGVDYWLSKLMPLIQELEEDKPRTPLPPCAELTLLSHWLDARLGVATEDWLALAPVATRFASRYPELAEAAEHLEAVLRPADLRNRDTYRAALHTTYEQVQVLYRKLAAKPFTARAAPEAGQQPEPPPSP